MNEILPRLSLFVAGEWRGSHNRDSQAVLNPATGRAIAELPHASAADLDAALDSASVAFRKWRNESPTQRGAILRRAALLIRERQEVDAAAMTREQGKPLAESRLELSAAADILDWTANEGLRAYGRVIPSRQLGTRQMALKEPIGVVAAFSPWNFPAATPMRKIAAALAAGCTCIIKPSEETPGTALAIARAFHDAGLPRGVLNVIFGVPDQISKRIVTAEAVRKISFTGSTAVGKQVLALASQGLKRTTLELGGHAPFIVFDDVDVEQIAMQAVTSKFRNAGQICTAPSRFFVQGTVYRRFVERFVSAASQIRVGPGDQSDTMMGPLANERRIRALDRLVSDAKQTGATVECGGHRIGDKGFYWAPTVLSDVPAVSLCMREEPFGPLAAIVPFDTEDDAIALANALPYGLASYAFTQDANRVVRLADAIEAGMLGINSLAITLPETPFGGVKESGYGIEGGIEGVESYMCTKFVSQGPAIPRPRD
jgi:succinate-semialdehyde dehydrogenase / glutarate-semialdehyde dehydrogenase